MTDRQIVIVCFYLCCFIIGGLIAVWTH